MLFSGQRVRKLPLSENGIRYRNFSVPSVFIRTDPYLNSDHSADAAVFRELILRMGTDWYGVPRKPIRQGEIC